MADKKIKIIDGDVITTMSSYNPNLLNKLRENASGLVEKIFFEVHKFPMTIEVRRASEGYKYDIDYGKTPPLPFNMVSELQETARKSLEVAREHDSSREKVKLTYTYWRRNFDPFGIGRLTKFLLYGKQ